MAHRIIATGDVPSQAWHNGGGQTHELLTWPDAAGPWQLRLSVARIDRDGPFSALPGVRRWLAVIEGPGIALQWPGGARVLVPADGPHAFDGALAPHCRLLAGATRDLNLMLRAGRATMAAAGAAEHAPAHAQNGLYAVAAGTWIDGAGRRVELPPDTLLWQEDPALGPWRFEARAGAGPAPAALWLGYTPP
jgi:environmental stress-induced protein Ves